MVKIDIAFAGQKRDLNQFLVDLFEADSFGEGTRKEIGGAILELQPMKIEKSAGGDYVINIVMSLATGVIGSLVANYIWEKLHKHEGKHIRIIVDRREFHFTKSHMTKIIEEHIENDKLES